MENIVIATIKEWNISNYFIIKNNFNNSFNFHLITDKNELTSKYISKLQPKYIFFPHWSWIIPEKIYINYECIVFHMTDLPFGRGGSPLQNLILNEVYDTKVSALKVNGKLDGGDIYIKNNFNISIGSAGENFIKLSAIIFNKMIPKILTTTLTPQKQTGVITVFNRRNEEDSNMSALKDFSISKLYDFIRMLDAEGYPKAYIKFGDLKLEFSEVHLKNKKLVGRFEVILNV